MSDDVPPVPPAVPEVMPTGSPTNDEKLWATFAHLSSLLGWTVLPSGNIVGPLIIWLIKRNDSPFVDAHGKESLNFQISLLIYGLIGGLIVAITCGIAAILVVPALIAMVIAAVVFAIIASLKANKGEMYQYPLTIRLIK